jgi:hypothetical protein
MILLFAAAVFALDLVAPLGIPYWLLYGAPFFFLRYNRRRYFPYVLAAVCTVFLFAGYALSSEGKAEPLTHRASAAIVLWIIAIGLGRRPELQSSSRWRERKT